MSASDSFAPVFIVGFPRSGTTLLAVLLDRHPQIAIGPESHFFEVIAQLRMPAMVEEPQLWLERILAAPRMCDLALKTADVSPHLPPGRTATTSDIFAAILRGYQAARGKPLVGEKTPSHLLELPKLLTWYPNAKAICLLRDGRDAVASMLQVPWRNHSSARLYSLRWARFLQLAEQAKKDFGDRVLIVRYKRLVLEPEQQLREIDRFIGVDFDPSQLDVSQATSAVPQWEASWKAAAGNAPDQQHFGLWQQRLSPREQRIVSGTLHSTLRHYGYVDSRTEPPGGLAARIVSPDNLLSRGFFRKLYLKIIRLSKTYQWREQQYPRDLQ